MWSLCAEIEAVFCGPWRKKDEERRIMSVEREKILEYR